jgi:4-hydroxy-2-oxoheptanedioate aldolase
MRKLLLVTCVIVAIGFVGLTTVESAPPPTAKRINRAIELLEQDQMIYYSQIAATEISYQKGKEMAGTWADYITVEMEHGSYDIPGLRAFMQGLVDAGPTKSGHRTPTVICTLPVGGISPDVMRANYWMVEQVLGSGVHGILLVHARSPEAVRVFVEASRYVSNKLAVGSGGLGEGMRGAGGQGYASRIWGISGEEYTRKAEPWPLNPEGELLLGLKIEDRHALQNAEASVAVPGIGFAEWGPGDMGMSLGVPGAAGRNSPLMRAARDRVFAATKKAKIAFLNQVTPETIKQMIDEGVRIGSGGGEASEIGRKYQKRKMPW